MSRTLRICLKSGERIFVNGAELRADRKVTLEILNEVTFLLEHHVLQPSEATTPLRQLYIQVQSMLMMPAQTDALMASCVAALAGVVRGSTNADIVAGLYKASDALQRQRTYEALKLIRTLLPLEVEGGTEKSAEAGSAVSFV